MKHARRGSKVVAALGIAMALASGPALGSALAAEPGSLSEKVEGAKTASDHEALAADYEREAASAKAKAEEHRKMGAFYKGQPAISGGKAFGVSAMPQHCEKLAKSFEEQATMYTAMAAVERELAKVAK